MICIWAGLGHTCLAQREWKSLETQVEGSECQQAFSPNEMRCTGRCVFGDVSITEGKGLSEEVETAPLAAQEDLFQSFPQVLRSQILLPLLSFSHPVKVLRESLCFIV